MNRSDTFSALAMSWMVVKARIVKLLVERVTVTAEGLAVDLRTGGLGTVVREMLAPKPEEAVA